MDEACLNVGKTTDAMLLEVMDKKLKGNEHYTSRSVDSKINKNLVIGQDFVIKHYAGIYFQSIPFDAFKIETFLLFCLVYDRIYFLYLWAIK